MSFVDIHCHLDHEKFKNDLDDVIKNASKAGVKVIVANGINKETNRFVLDLASKYSEVKAALAVFPTEVFQKEAEEAGLSKPKPFNIDEEIEFIKKNKDKISAIGECGLDLHWVKKLNGQKELFEKMISLAEKLKKPIEVHSRDAEKEVLDMLESSSLKKVILHCFGGGLKLVKRGGDLGYSFSIPTNVVFSSHFQRIVEEVNINNLFTETDAPFLGPFKGERNEPKNIPLAVKKIAELKSFDEKETENTLFLNYQRMF